MNRKSFRVSFLYWVDFKTCCFFHPAENCLVEQDDHVEVNGVVFNKPFVEKPVSAEDHNIYVYYPSSAGGGSQRLFRKIGSRSSFYSSESTIRKAGSYIYEDFMPTDGTDVKGLCLWIAPVSFNIQIKDLFIKIQTRTVLVRIFMNKSLFVQIGILIGPMYQIWLKSSVTS